MLLSVTKIKEQGAHTAVSDGNGHTPIVLPSKKCLGLGKTFLNAWIILSTATESHRRWMMATSPKGNSHQQQFGSGSISFGIERAAQSNGRGSKRTGSGLRFPAARPAGAAGARLSDFPSRAAGAAVTHPGWAKAAPGSAARSISQTHPRGCRALGCCSSQLQMHREEVGGAWSYFCKTTLGNFGSIDGKTRGVSQIRG